MTEARDACVERYLREEGQGAPRCEFSIPGGADPKYRELSALCLAQCSDRGKAKLAEQRASRPAEAAPAPAPDPIPAPAPAGGGSGDRVRCCDGTLSPSCTYGRPSLRGCCSRHGGVC
jgi:hypothetical protein